MKYKQPVHDDDHPSLEQESQDFSDALRAAVLNAYVVLFLLLLAFFVAMLSMSNLSASKSSDVMSSLKQSFPKDDKSKRPSIGEGRGGLALDSRFYREYQEYFDHGDAEEQAFWQSFESYDEVIQMHGKTNDFFSADGVSLKKDKAKMIDYLADLLNEPKKFTPVLVVGLPDAPLSEHRLAGFADALVQKNTRPSQIITQIHDQNYMSLEIRLR